MSNVAHTCKGSVRLYGCTKECPAYDVRREVVAEIDRKLAVLIERRGAILSLTDEQFSVLGGAWFTWISVDK